MPGRLKPSRHGELDRIGRRVLSCFLDLTAFSCAVLVAFELRFDGALPAQNSPSNVLGHVRWAGLQSAAFIGFRVSSDHGAIPQCMTRPGSWWQAWQVQSRACW